MRFGGVGLGQDAGEPKTTGGLHEDASHGSGGVPLVLASGCGGRLDAGSVDAARAARIEAARKKGDLPIETENVKSLGEGRYENVGGNKGTLGSSVTTCTYDKKIGAAIR
jgi:hypothetical protein